VNPTTLVLIRDESAAGLLQENWEHVQDFRLEDGSKPVAALPTPAPAIACRRASKTPTSRTRR
jgi:hypothetical protein